LDVVGFGTKNSGFDFEMKFIKFGCYRIWLE